MLNLDFNNGKKLNLLSALAMFAVIMGFLFLIAAAPGAPTFAAVGLIVFGSAGYFTNWLYRLREHHPSH